MAVRYLQSFISWNCNLCVGITPIQPSFITFEITQPTHLQILAHIVLKHRGNYSGGIGWGLRGGLRGPGATHAAVQVATNVQTNQPTWIKGCKTADNLRDIVQHYASPALTGYKLITEPGWYRFEVWGLGHWSQALPNTASLLEVNGEGGADDPYNSIVLRLEDA